MRSQTLTSDNRILQGIAHHSEKEKALNGLTHEGFYITAVEAGRQQSIVIVGALAVMLIRLGPLLPAKHISRLGQHRQLLAQ